jgi:hypothetical protein
MTGTVKKCPFADGCPFKGCHTNQEIAAKMTTLRDDPTWAPLLEKMKGSPLWAKCQMSNPVVTIS